MAIMRSIFHAQCIQRVKIFFFTNYLNILIYLEKNTPIISLLNKNLFSIMFIINIIAQDSLNI